MALIGARWSFFRPAATIFFIFILAFVLVDADERNKQHGTEDLDSSYLMKVARFLRKYDFSGYPHVWPEMEFGWKIVVGTIIGCFGAAFGSVGGVGGGGIFIPMFMLIIGFDAKSSAALSKCMITGAAVSTVYHNMKLRHPTLDIPIFEYDLVLLILPYLLLGISIGVTFSVIFPDWVITALLIILFLGTAVKAFFKGIDTWKQETILKEDAAKRLHPTDANLEVDYKPLLGGSSNNSEKPAKEKQFNVLRNIRWMELGLVVFVWIGFLILQIAKNYTTTCSTAFWVLNLLQIPVSGSVSLYQAIGLYKGTRKVQLMGEAMNCPVRKLLAFCICGMVAGTIGGLLGIGGGFVMGALFIKIGIHPLVSSATATLGMTFSASMSVVEYYLLDRFPIPYALYFIAMSIVAAFVGQHIITKLITITGWASLIIFVLSFTIFISGISLGGVGISNMIGKIERGESMGFEDLCNQERIQELISEGMGFREFGGSAPEFFFWSICIPH